MAAAATIRSAVPAAERRPFWTGTPEIYFAKAIEYGYQIESAKRELAGLTEMNHALRLEDASLRDPERIDVLARRMGLVPPEPGQVIRMDGNAADAQGPVMASNAPVMVVAQ